VPRPDRPLGGRGRAARGGAARARAGARSAAALALAAAAAWTLASAGEPAPEAAAGASAAARVEVRRDASGFSVRARGATRIETLRALGRAAGFAVEPGLGRPPPRLLTLELSGATLEEAIGAILAGIPYHLHYERAMPRPPARRPTGEASPRPGASGRPGEVALRRVTVGLSPPAEAGEGAPRLGPPRLEAPRGLGEAAARAARDDARASDAEAAGEGSQRGEPEALEEERRRAEIEAAWDSRAEAERARAAALMSPDEDAARLIELLRVDPSPRVRARAAASLADVQLGEEAFAAADALLAALDDSDPAVVAAAVRALEDVHDVLPDPRIREAVAPLAASADPEVSEAVRSLLAWTEEEP
jgi:hypothetical protein